MEAHPSFIKTWNPVVSDTEQQAEKQSLASITFSLHSVLLKCILILDTVVDKAHMCIAQK